MNETLRTLYNLDNIPLKLYLVIGITSTLVFIFSISFNSFNIPTPQNINQILSFVGIVLFSFPIGFVALLPFRNNIPLFNLIYFPIIISIGLILNLIWMFSLSVFTLNLFVMNSLLIISIPIFFIFFIKHYRNSHTTFSSKKELIKQFIPLILFLFFLLYVISIIDFYEYPAMHSDLTDYHALLIQSIIHQDQLSFFYDSEIMYDATNRIFVDNNPIAYPQGFHVTTAVYSKLFGINPTQQGFVINGIAISLIFGSLISLAFTLSKSYFISLVSVLAFFYTGIRGHQEFYLYGTFITALSPLLLGILGILLTLTILFSINSKKEYSLSIFIVILISVGVIHPPSAMFVIVIFLGYIISNYNRQYFNTIKKSLKTIFSRKFSSNDLILCIIFIGVILGGTYMVPINAISGYTSPVNFSAIIDADHDLFLGLSRTIDDGYLIYSSIILSTLLFFNIFYIKENRSFSITLLAFIIPIFFVSSSELLILFFIPIRLSVLIIPLAWIVIGMTILPIEKFISIKLSKSYDHGNASSKSILPNEIQYKNHWFLRYHFLTIFYFFISIIIFYEQIFEIFNYNSLIYEILPTDKVQCIGISLHCT